MVHVAAQDPLRLVEDEEQIIRDKLSNISKDALVYRYTYKINVGLTPDLAAYFWSGYNN